MRYRLLSLITSLVSYMVTMAQAYVVSPVCPDFMDIHADYVEAHTGNTNNPFASQGIVNNRHTLITTQGTDPNTGDALALLPPGESRVVRIGNERVGSEAEALTYHFIVDKNNPVLLLKFAVVLEDPQHPYAAQPRFVVRITDKEGKLIEECAEYDVSASGNIPGFQTYNKNISSPVRWRDWTNVGLDMSSFIGKEVQVQFITYDCDYSAHFGYAYFTASCIPNSLQLEVCSGTSFTVEAPDNFASYLWDNGDETRTSTRTATENNSPLSCLVTSATGCQFTLNAYASNTATQTTFIQDTVCEGDIYAKNYFNLPEQYKIGTNTYYNTILNTDACITTQVTELELVVLPRYTRIKTAICQGEDSYTENGFNIIQPAAGIRRDSLFLKSSNGRCDSIVCLELTVNPSFAMPNVISGDASPCTGILTTYSFAGAELLAKFSWQIPTNAVVVGKSDQPQITLYFTNDTPVVLSLNGENGCGSRSISLKIYPRQTYSAFFTDTICSGTDYDKHDFHLGVQNELGYFVYTHDFKTTLGCDSSVTLALTVFPALAAPHIVGDTISCNPGEEIRLLAIVEGEMAFSFNPEMLKDSTFSYAYDCEIEYRWSTGSTGSSITETPNASTLYSVTATNSTGCSATAQQWVMVETDTPQIINETICKGETYTKYGLSVDMAGDYQVGITGKNCTVPITVNLTILPVYHELLEDVTCYGTPYTKHGLNITPYEEGAISQTFHYQTKAGCDSTVTIQLLVSPEKMTIVRDTICQNSRYTKNGFSLPEQIFSGLQTYTKDVEAAQGCDSTVTLRLFVNPVYNNMISDEVNIGEAYEKYEFKFPNVTADLTETKQLKTSCGCDSTVILNLKAKEKEVEYVPELNETICKGDSILFGNQYYKEAGIYSDTLKTVSGQDSIIVTLELKVNPVYNDSPVTETICEGDYIFFGKQYYKQTGIYTDTLKTVFGCDSIVTLDLTVKPAPSMTVVEEMVCQNDTVHLIFTGIAPFELDYAFNGTRQNITVSGMDTVLAATQTGENLFIMYELISGDGCSLSAVFDKGVEINGVIWATRNVDKPGTFTATPEDAGWFYQWGKNVGWSTEDPMINTNGGTNWDRSFPPNTGKWEAENDPCPCGWRVPTREEQWDMIGEGSADIIQHGVRGRLSRTDRNTIFLPYALTTDGLIAGWRNIGDGSLQLFAANDYSSGPHHSDYWSGEQESGTQAWNLCFRMGYPLQEPGDKRFCPLLRCVKDITRCPQINTITVNSIKSDTVKVAICPNDSVLFNEKYYHQAGIYTETLKTTSGCDSIMTLDLKVNSVYQDSPVTAAICQGDSIFFGSQYYKQAGIYTETLKTVFGCDSIVTLDLIVNPVPSVTVIERTICQNDTVHLAFTGVAPFDLDYTFNGTKQNMTIPGMNTMLVATQTGENLFIVNRLTSGNGCSLPGINPEYGVEINDVIWATRNVDAPGTFAANPEDTGMFYQWNSMTGWSATDPLTSTDGSSWNNSWDGNSAITWETTNNICPSGFRVPTYAELRSLVDAGSQWTTINGVRGRVFGSGDNTIFLPVTGYRDGNNGTFRSTDVGFYWSSTVYEYSQTEVYALISGGDMGWYSGYRGSGFNIRCVVDTIPEIIFPITVHPIKSDTINIAICTNDSVLFNGKYYHQAGTYSNTLETISGCDSIITLHLTVQDSSRITILPEDPICQNGEKEITLTAKVETGNPTEIAWYDDARTPIQDGKSVKQNVMPVEHESNYWAYAIDPVCGDSPDAYATVLVTHKVYLLLNIDTTKVQIGDEITLTVTPTNDEHGNFFWYDASTDELLAETIENWFKYTLNKAGNYVFYVLTENGYCPDATSKEKNASAADYFIIPNIITPYNYNQRNDSFMEGYKVEIYNRYQQKVHEGDNGWNGMYRGKLAEPGTYFYRLFMKDGKILKGTVEVAKF